MSVWIRQGWEFTLLLIRSKSLILKSDREQFAHVVLYKRANRCHRSLKYSNLSDSLAIQVNRSQKTSDWLEKFVFYACFWLFSPFYVQKQIAPVAHSLFFKERLERFAPVVLYKRTTVSDLRITLSLTKTSESLEKPNSQPWNQGHLGGSFEWGKNSGLNLVTFFLLSLQS